MSASIMYRQRMDFSLCVVGRFSKIQSHKIIGHALLFLLCVLIKFYRDLIMRSHFQLINTLF